MNKCSPVEMRKNMETAEIYKRGGIDFVCVPVNGNKDELHAQVDAAMDGIIQDAKDELEKA